MITFVLIAAAMVAAALACVLLPLLKRGEADAKAKPEQFRRYGSARKLYNFNIDNASAY